MHANQLSTVFAMVGRVRGWIALVAMALFLAGCLESVPTATNPPTASTVRSYTGAAPATGDVQAFMTNLWENIKPTNRCGGCHGAGGQSPMFARDDDVNLAYSEAINLVSLQSPSDSRLVTKVAAGHNCWLDSDSACGAVMAAYISAWAGGTVESATTTIELEAPVIKDPGSSRNFPADSASFAATVHPILIARCSGCHTDSAQVPQAPFFANADADSAYEAVRASRKIDLDTPANSRLVVRLREEFHNCWSGDCAADANTMQAAIEAFAAGIPLTTIDPQLVVSKALLLTDGIVAAGGSRHEANLIAKWEFKTGSGSTAYDTSGIEPAMHLNLSGTEDINYRWVGGWGIEFISGKAQASTASSRKLIEHIQATGEYSIEAWVVPGNVTQEGPAGIISYSGGTTTRNFTLGQVQYNYVFQNRSSSTDANGMPALSTADADERLQATQQHVVVTFDAVGGRKIYVNGEYTGDLDPQVGGNLNDWDDTFAFVLGNEVSNDRQWQGKLRLVAIHSRALTAEQIQQNFEVGVGEKFFLLFSVSDLIGIPDSYVYLEVSEFDSYGYLFYRPTFIILDPLASPGASIPVKAMRIGINGKEASIGQAYRNLDTVISDAVYTSSGQVLSTLGTVIAKEKGADQDEFFLTFETLGANVNVVTEESTLTAAPAVDLDPVSDIGMRTFDEINASMSQITGVSTTNADVDTTFTTIKQQLPTVENIEGFLSAHQMAVTQLAISYCDAMVEDATLRTNFFGAFGFTSDVATAFGSGDTAAKNQIVNALYDKVLGLPGSGAALADMPTLAEVKAELIGPGATTYNVLGTNYNITNLFDRLTASCPTGCDQTRTRTIVKAMCSATLGSAGILMQ